MNFHWRLESRQNPQAGKPAPRRADILVGEFRPHGNIEPVRGLDESFSSRTEPLCERTGSVCGRTRSVCERNGSLCGRTRPVCGRNGSLRAGDESFCARAGSFFR